MVGRLPRCLHISPQVIIRRSIHTSPCQLAKAKAKAKPFDFGPDGPPLHDAKGRGLRTTRFRLPYLSNLKKMDPVFDDPYDVAAQTIRKRAKPGDPQVVIDPDGLYEEDDADGMDDEEKWEDIHEDLRPVDNIVQKKTQVDELVETTGLAEELVRGLMLRSIIARTVTNQTRNGKVHSRMAIALAGDGNGLVGYGAGKSLIGATAYRVSIMRAVKHMVPINRYEDRTVYGTIRGKYGATIVELRSRPPGFGIRANYFVHEVCACAGLKDVSGQVFGSKNGMNIIKAVFEALKTQKLPEMIAKERGKHVIDVRERLFHGR
jgi:ribosomal protein S5